MDAYARIFDGYFSLETVQEGTAGLGQRLVHDHEGILMPHGSLYVTEKHDCARRTHVHAREVVFSVHGYGGMPSVTLAEYARQLLHVQSLVRGERHSVQIGTRTVVLYRHGNGLVERNASLGIVDLGRYDAGNAQVELKQHLHFLPPA